jgi:curli biogenesis system outer membrane secretion channel CsgG
MPVSRSKLIWRYKMKKINRQTIFAIIIGILATAVLSCGSTVSKSIILNPKHKDYNCKTILVLPFDDENKEPYKQMNPNSAKIMREAVETSLIKTGMQIIERSKIDKIIDEMSLSKTGLTEDDGKKIGQMLNADTIIFGSVTLFVQGARSQRKAGKKLEKTSVGVNLKAVHVEKGVILWKASVVDQIDSATKYTNPVEGHAIKVAGDIINELIAGGLYR